MTGLIEHRKRMVGGLILCALLTLTGGCGMITISKEKTQEPEYTVLCEKELPDELLEIINQKKENSFKITYEGDGYLYICQGYGKQPQAGYSIRVDHVYETGNAVYFKSSLIGPSQEDAKKTQPTCPYIVVKMEYRDKTTVFG